MRSSALALLLALTSTAAGCRSADPKSAVKASFRSAELASFTSARLRRLSNAEYEATVHRLLETREPIAHRLPPDLEVDGYTRNDTAPVSSTFATRLRTVAAELGAEYAERRRKELSCAKGEGRTCAAQFIDEWGTMALRRPLRASEESALLGVYEKALALEGDHVQALGWVVSTLLQAPSLLYVSEEGVPTNDARVNHLTSYEIASVLSYMLRGQPPDEELILAAAEGLLLLPEERERHARRLLTESDARFQFRTFVRQWLEIDNLQEISKDAEVAPDFEALKPRMLNETEAFVDEVMVRRGASVASLLSAGFASVDPKMARYYGLDAWGPRVPSAGVGRVGLLQQASFLSAHAHPDGTSPIKRGDFVLRRILCVDMPRPDEIGIEVIIPPVTTHETTRERFSAHVSNKGCAACHDVIDPLGFSFEDFDAAGRKRESESGFAVVTEGRFKYEDYDVEFSSSVELSRWLAQQQESERCFRRHALRFFAADGRKELARALERVVGELPEEHQPNLLENLVAYAKSDLFLYRKVEP